MKSGRNLRDLQLEFQQRDSMTCMVCGRATRHAYGRWTSGITCNRDCNEKHVTNMKERFHGTTVPGVPTTEGS